MTAPKPERPGPVRPDRDAGGGGEDPRPVHEGKGPAPARASGGDADKASGDTGKPISARAAMGATAPETETTPELLPAPTHRFHRDGREWLARVAGEAAYGTGRFGRAYIIAIHFCEADDQETPIREALIPIARFDGLDETELQELFDRATPIERDDD